MKAGPGVLLLGLLATVVACDTDVGRDVAADGPPGPVVREARLGPVQLEARLDPEHPRFGQRLRLTLDVILAPPALVEECSIGARLGHLRVRSRKGPREVGAGRQRYSVEAEPERTGTNIVRFPEVVFRPAPGEAARVLRLEPLEIEVAGLEPGSEPDLAEIAPPLPPVPLPPRDVDRRVVWWTLAGVAAALAVGAWLWRRRGAGRVPAEPVIDPVEEARAALEALLARGLVEAGQVDVFYVELTAIVRRFIERTTGIHAPEQTTEEFLRAMEGSAQIPLDRRLRLQEFLEAADLVKFAALVPGAGEVAAAVEAARTFVGIAPPGRSAA